jgi:hypothetical protein
MLSSGAATITEFVVVVFFLLPLLLLDAVVGAEHSSFLYTSVVGRAAWLALFCLFFSFFAFSLLVNYFFPFFPV